MAIERTSDRTALLEQRKVDAGWDSSAQPEVDEVAITQRVPERLDVAPDVVQRLDAQKPVDFSMPKTAVAKVAPGVNISEIQTPFDPFHPGQQPIAIDAPLNDKLVQSKPLTNQKVVVLVESQYVTPELAAYAKRFTAYGAKVVFAGNLYNQEKLTFESHKDKDVVPQATTLDVNVDVKNIDLTKGDIAAVIQSVHTQQRERYTDSNAVPGADAVADERQAPVVDFVRRALVDPRIVVGAMGHGVEILTSLGQELGGARFTSPRASAAALQLAGLKYDPPPVDSKDSSNWAKQVVVERKNGVNLVTGTEVLGGGLESFIDHVTTVARDVAGDRAKRTHTVLGQLATETGSVEQRRHYLDWLTNEHLVDQGTLTALQARIEDPKKLAAFIKTLDAKAVAEARKAREANKPTDRTGFITTPTLAGEVVAVNPDGKGFTARLKDGRVVPFEITGNTYVQGIPHIDKVSRDAFPEQLPGPGAQVVTVSHPRHVDRTQTQMVDVKTPIGGSLGDLSRNAQNVHALQPGQRFIAKTVNHGDGVFSAREISVAGSRPGEFNFEKPDWYPSQLQVMGQRWLDVQFPGKETITADDYKGWQTFISGEGQKLSETIQNTATLGRFTYGMDVTYMLTGKEKFLKAAKAGIDYERQNMRVQENGVTRWLYGTREGQAVNGKVIAKQEIPAGEGGDDPNAIALYHQIYSIAGMAMYYRATLDKEVLDDIKGTMDAFDKYFKDPIHGGYYSHVGPSPIPVDVNNPNGPTTFSPNDPRLDNGSNRARHNWNSEGDHMPAYLINVINALGPKTKDANDPLNAIRDQALNILKETSHIIATRFPDPKSAFVLERRKVVPDAGEENAVFPKGPLVPEEDHTWQGGDDRKGRGVTGHNFKIAWQAFRCSAKFEELATEARVAGDAAGAADYTERAKEQRKLGLDQVDKMIKIGISPAGATFDTFNRTPINGEYRLAWDGTEDFWQDEQSILALLQAHAAVAGPENKETPYLAMARLVQTHYNRFQFNQDTGAVHFRTDINGAAVTDGMYAQEGDLAKADYHAAENAFLAHIYNQTYVNRQPFTLHMQLAANRVQNEVQMRPDFLKSDFEYKVRMDGHDVKLTNPRDPVFTLPESAKGKQVKLEVTLVPIYQANVDAAASAKPKRKAKAS